MYSNSLQQRNNIYINVCIYGTENTNNTNGGHLTSWKILKILCDWLTDWLTEWCIGQKITHKGGGWRVRWRVKLIMNLMTCRAWGETERERERGIQAAGCWSGQPQADWLPGQRMFVNGFTWLRMSVRASVRVCAWCEQQLNGPQTLFGMS